MKQGLGDIWRWPGADVRVITTNGDIKKDGTAVMGRGVALEAKKLFPGVESKFAKLLTENGNHVQVLGTNASFSLVAFPTKHHWTENSSISLILQSCREIVELADKYSWKRIVLPRPGCGNGGLDWKKVQPHIEKILDDRFYVVYRP